MKYNGVIIEESLIDTKIIEELNILQREIEEINKEDNTPWLTK